MRFELVLFCYVMHNFLCFSGLISGFNEVYLMHVMLIMLIIYPHLRQNARGGVMMMSFICSFRNKNEYRKGKEVV